MLLIPCYLGASSIEGLGLFTRQAIRAGETLWAFDARFDRLIPMADLEAAPPTVQDFLWRYTYPYASDPSLLVFEADEARHMNHSDTPNTDFSRGDIAIALRDIAAGEELTCNYRDFLPELYFYPSRHEVVG
jgi:hypothetical protein